MTNKAPILIALPTGLTIGGVQVWAARLANELAKRGRTAGLLLHPAQGPRLDIELHPGIKVYQLPLSKARGGDAAEKGPVPSAADLTPYLADYERAVDELHALTGQPVVGAPNHLGDCYGLFATIAARSPAKLRVVGWCHSAIPYDARVLEYYEPLLTHLVPVSDSLESSLGQRLPARASDLRNIPCGVEVGPARPRRSRWNRKSTVPLRLIYVGRLDDDIKRVSILPVLSRQLSRRKILHTLTIVGDGPVQLAPLPGTDGAFAQAFTLIRDAGPARIAGLLDQHDIFVLPSRLEGLSIAMLEAMGRGCVPLVTRTSSGAAQVIGGGNGLIIESPPDACHDYLGQALSSAVIAMAPGLHLMSLAAQETIAKRYSLSSHTDAVEQLLDQAAAAAPRGWPRDRACLFTTPDPVHGSGAVPPHGPERLRELLESLAGRRVILHGAGQHTRELAPVLAAFPNVIALTDDDPARQGQTLCNLPIIPPSAAARHGASDIVISSWLNQEVIWSRRGVYESQDLRVHRVYPKAA